MRVQKVYTSYNDLRHLIDEPGRKHGLLLLCCMSLN